MSVWANLITVYLVWGSTYLAIHFAIESIPPLLMAAIRFLVAGSVFYLWEKLTSKQKSTAQHWRSGFITGGLLLLGGNGLVVIAQQYVPSGTTALLVSMVPLWMVLLETIRPNGVPLKLNVALGTAGGFMGMMLLLGPHAWRGAFDVQPIGVILLVIASMSWAIGSLYSRQAALPSSHRLSAAVQMLSGGVLLLAASLIKGEMTHFNFAQITTRSIWSLIYLIVFGALVGFTAYTWLLKSAPVALVSTYAYINPVVALVLGVIFGGEKISAQMVMASAIIIFSVMLVSVPRKH